MRLWRYIPCFAILLVLYNVLMLIPVTSSGFKANLSVIQIPMMSQPQPVLLTVSEVFALLGIICLYFEVLKATRTSRDTLIDHVLSVGVLILCIIEFIVVPGAATSSFLILTLLSLVDVITGFTVTFATSRRDINFGDRA